MWIGSMTLDDVKLYFVASPNKGRLRLTFQNLGGVILPALLAKLIVHPHTIHMKLYSSRYYSLKVLFITALSSEVPHYYS